MIFYKNSCWRSFVQLGLRNTVVDPCLGSSESSLKEVVWFPPIEPGEIGQCLRKQKGGSGLSGQTGWQGLQKRCSSGTRRNNNRVVHDDGASRSCAAEGKGWLLWALW